MVDRAAYTEARRVARASAKTAAASLRRHARAARYRDAKTAAASLRRHARAARYRDPETGACLTCVAVCECTGGRVLRCSWCKNLDGGSS